MTPYKQQRKAVIWPYVPGVLAKTAVFTLWLLLCGLLWGCQHARGAASSLNQPLHNSSYPLAKHHWQLSRSATSLLLLDPQIGAGLRLSFIRTGGSAKATLGHMISLLRQKQPQLQIKSVALDTRTNGQKIAQCDVLVSSSHGPRYERWVVSSGGTRGLVSVIFAPPSLFPAVQTELTGILHTLLSSSPQANNKPLDQPTGFRQVVTQDGGMAIDIPSHWHLREPSTTDLFQCVSPYGETFTFAGLLIPADEEAVHNRILIARLSGIALTEHDIAVLHRFMSPPLSPREVIQTLMPKVLEGIANLHVLKAMPLASDEQAALSQQGLQGAVVLYEYTLVPSRLGPTSREQLPSVLRKKSATHMEGAALVITSPLRTDPVQGNVWTLFMTDAECPVDLVRPNWPLYAHIANSMQLNMGLFEQKLRWDAQVTQEIGDFGNQMRQMQYQQFQERMSQQLYDAEQWIATFAGHSLYTSRETGKVYSVPWDYADWFKTHPLPAYRLGDIPNPTVPWYDPLRPARPGDIQWPP
ncbi:MAG TPA: hypothetical protein VKV29_06205 [Chthonomonas sp.]|jgi:hypothetical protein|uniref:hypothetical protein n=1 Tax=Chthonomonas sp. TaxID=2282153 RepID=UPI002B4B71E1|nr:hypothetical protein [Chthonomonas sp.]HLH79861.1 hypothetical protein [Chthonomonas sp.]